MSDKSGSYNEGLDRAKDGKSSADPAIDLNMPNDAEKASRQQGYQDGKAAQATADAIAEKQTDNSKKE